MVVEPTEDGVFNNPCGEAASKSVFPEGDDDVYPSGHDAPDDTAPNADSNIGHSMDNSPATTDVTMATRRGSTIFTVHCRQLLTFDAAASTVIYTNQS